MLLSLITTILRFLLHLRYRVEIRGLDQLQTDQPIIVFPNHPALVDPMILLTHLGRDRILSPVMTQTYFSTPGLGPILRMLRTIPVGDLDRGADLDSVRQAFGGIEKAIAQRQNILIYPSGHIYVQPYEHILGKKMAYEIVGMIGGSRDREKQEQTPQPPLTGGLHTESQQSPHILVVRTKGLWGSMWGKAYTGISPDLIRVILASLWFLLANLIFFMPRRRVEIEIVDMTEKLTEWQSLGVDTFNKKLQDYYNEAGKEECRFLPHYFWRDDVKGKQEPQKIAGSEAELSETESIDPSEISTEILETIQGEISRIKKKEIVCTLSTRLILDLAFDSLDLAELKSSLQAKSENPSNPPITTLKTVGDLALMMLGKSREVEKLKPCEWGKKITNDELGTTSTGRGTVGSNDLSQRIEGWGDSRETILTLWKKNFSTSRDDSFLWDNILGMQSKKDFALKAYLIAGYLRSMPGDKIGMMLPAVGSASLLIIACFLARKTPVMLNWTLSREAFQHTVRFSGISTILSSSAFYEKVKNETLEEYLFVQEKERNDETETPLPPLTGGLPSQIPLTRVVQTETSKDVPKFLFLEDLLRDIPLARKICAVIESRLMMLPKKTPETAVILFTSGSESLPKAVALTHQNLISDIRGSIEIFRLKDDDILLGFLPPFHSFGFTINTIMPLITGLHLVNTPDPNDPQTILSIIRHTRVTAITATPTFLRMILSIAHPGDLDSIRYVVVGAEKCPKEVFEKFAQLCPAGKILEGYGITECSPVISINPIEGSKPGTVGRILPHLDCRIVEIETGVEKSTGEQGMILVAGDSVFAGYLDEQIESPFVRGAIENSDRNRREGVENSSGSPLLGGVRGGFHPQKLYYQTGDLGFLDEDGFLTITGRLKRFVKIAGEMISLPFIEGVLLEKYGNPESLTMAIEAREINGLARFVLFSTHPIDLDEAHEYLRSRGVSTLVKLSENHILPEIPVLGTGKVDYRVLKGMIA